MNTDLVTRLRALSRHGHDDHSVGDEAANEIESWRNAAAHVEGDHPDERHCGCVAILRSQLTAAAGEIELLRAHATDLNIEIERLRKERDDARREVCEPIARQVPDKSTP